MRAGMDGERAYVLHRRSFGEKDLLLELWTREQGRLPVMAHRVRGSRGNRQAELVPYQLLSVSLRGRGEVLSLQAWESPLVQRVPSGNDALTGLYLNELLYRLLPRGEAEPLLFDRYQALLEHLLGPCESESRIAELDAALRSFELALLAALGYGLELSQCRSGSVIDPEGRYLVDLQAGVRAVVDGPWAGELLLSLAALQAEASPVLQPLALRRQQRRLLRALLGELLGDRPLASWSLAKSGH